MAVWSIEACSGGAEIAVGNSRGDVLRSTDGGATFKKVAKVLGGVTALKVSLDGNNIHPCWVHVAGRAGNTCHPRCVLYTIVPHNCGPRGLHPP